MKWPCDIKEYRISQHFGENPASYTRFGLLGHNGIDIACPTGTKLIAPISGKVLEVANDPTGYGLYIKIENDKGGCLLGHCQNILMNIGDIVLEGQTVAVSDNTGNSTGSHVHFGYYPIPRDRSNGYGGYINQEDLIKGVIIPSENDMTITSQTKIPQIDGMEVQAIASTLRDLNRDIENLKQAISQKDGIILQLQLQLKVAQETPVKPPISVDYSVGDLISMLLKKLKLA